MERVQAKVVRSDSATADYREDIVRSIFGEVGKPVEDFSCAVESRILLHGRMYVTNTFVCFYSNLFGFEKIIKIPFCHMRCITKEKTALFIPNAIAIITSKKEYIFRSFWDREDAFKTLKQCQQDASSTLTQQQHQQHAAAAESSLMLERELDLSSSRENEDPEQSQNQNQRHHGRRTSSSSRVGDEDDDQGKDLEPGQGARRKLTWSENGERGRSSSSLTVGEQQQSAAEGVGGKEEADGGAFAVEGNGRGGKGEGEDEGDAGLTVSDEYESEVDVLGVEGSPVTAVSLGATTGGGKMPSKGEDFKVALTALGEGWLLGDSGNAAGEGNQAERPKGKGAAVRVSTEIPCQLQDFFQLFISNDAEKGIPAFHQSMGDSDVKATPWKVAGGALGMTREIRFVHPISAPIGPNSTRAVKLQRCRLYDEHGLILETSTHLEDIVMSDYFQIDDRCVVQPGQDGAVRVDVEIEIKFFKSTMFRKTIETKSLSETRQVWESFIGMTKDAIRKRKPAMPVRTVTSGGDESDDEDRIRATRERLRERRKHRHHRTRHHHHPPPHAPHPPPPPAHPHDKPPDGVESRPRAKSATAAAPTMAAVPPRAPAQDAAPLRKRGYSGVGFDRKRGSSGGAPPERKRGDSGAGGGGGGGGGGEGGGGRKLVAAMDTAEYVVVPPVESLSNWLFSFAAVPWLLLALVLVAEVIAYSRFSSETAGFLEAAEAALVVLGGSRAEDGDGGGGVVGNRTAASRTALTAELARGLMRIYCRHRFLWPFSRFC
ncbi:conserved unknown protein [Ectocarpus siliculosus]|uniref:VASt domain-containing protein n=1 Tax=Ectocarpus siliculosus TaxID=2880 RepID=D7FKF6_ECTSI|nr:conserved unknown protein [Ectocarpus siliculosus]|eukprot:CBJ29358.1 conserved unknown protein [Ectocarpus siliculosus]